MPLVRNQQSPSLVAWLQKNTKKYKTNTNEYGFLSKVNSPFLKKTTSLIITHLLFFSLYLSVHTIKKNDIKKEVCASYPNSQYYYYRACIKRIKQSSFEFLLQTPSVEPKKQWYKKITSYMKKFHLKKREFFSIHVGEKNQKFSMK